MNIQRLRTPARVLNWSFFISIGAIVAAIILQADDPTLFTANPLAPDLLIIIGIASVAGLAFYIALGQLAARLGKSWILWVGLSIITAPVGPFIAYLMMRVNIADARRDSP
jgi:hypothetical protein